MSAPGSKSAVSSRPCLWMLEWLEARGESADEWLLDLPVRPEELRRPDGRVSWDVFLTLCARLASRGRPSGSPRQIGGEIADRILSRPELAQAVADNDWSGLYAEHAASIAHRLFTGLAQHVEKLSSERTALHLDLPSGGTDARGFFELVAGALERAPRMLDLPPAVVAAKLTRRSARYTLSLPPEGAERVEETPAAHVDAARRDEPNERVRQLVENIEDILCEVTSDGQLRYVSPSVTNLLGYPPEHFRGKNFVEFLLSEERPQQLESFVKSLRSGEPARVVFQAPRADGTRIWLEASVRPFGEARDDLRVACVLRDVSERTLSEQSLRASEQRYRDVVENSSDLMGVAEASGRLRVASPLLMQLLGPRAAGDTLDLLPFVHRDEREALGRAFRESARSAEAGALDLRLVLREAAPRWFDVRWSPFRDEDGRILLSLVMRDIEARRQSEDSLRAIAEGLSSSQAQSFAALVEQLAGALQSDSAMIARLSRERTGCCETLAFWADDRLADNFSYALEGTPCANVMRDELCCYPSGVQQLFPGDELLLSDGTEGYIGMPLRGERGQVLGLISALFRRPIADPERARSLLRILGKRAALELEREQLPCTEAKGATPEEPAVESSDQLVSERWRAEEDRRAEKLEAVGRLAGGVAHDFNNLLMAIAGYADLVLEGLGDDPSRHDVQEILNATRRGESLTRKLLAFGRRQVLQPTVVDLNAILTGLGPTLDRLLPDEIEIEARLQDDLWSVRADQAQLEQVIVHLAANARDAITGSGRIEIETTNVAILEASATRQLPGGDYACVTVADTGSGMDETTLSRIFEPFFTTKEREKSSGLGLSMVYGIVRQSDGGIEVASELGNGTRFRIYLPRFEEATAGRRRKKLERYRGDETILVVEDSDSVRQLVERHLSRLGYRVLVAADWSEAARHCEQHPEAIDLLIADLILPKMDGLEVARRARELRPELRVLYMSGFSDDLIGGDEQRRPDFVLLAKPFTPSMLLQAVRERLDDAASASCESVE